MNEIKILEEIILVCDGSSEMDAQWVSAMIRTYLGQELSDEEKEFISDKQ